ncbi:uncharacterized protein [Elaeis guineensis]|uniref:Uncharacterized protein LOC105059111 n=1 Tax=Elaeis guineensis var. tenera TaxID=51953 RepID=A0A6I9SAV2_ELAGV|nr:uncharacterized protein LOC105059111 [Elaeis guineensis]
MELRPLTPPSTNCFTKRAIMISNFKVQSGSNPSTGPPFHFNSHGRAQKNCLVSSALPETAASVIVSAIAVSAAAALLARRTKASDPTMSSLKICEDCGGSGICAECNGEGFVLKKLSEQSAEKARMAAKNMATRYTAGLPKKWSYCSKCSSARSCRTCGGTGRVSF